MAVKKSGLGKGLDSLIADKTPKQKKENTEGIARDSHGFRRR